MKKFIILLFGLTVAFGVSAQYEDWSKWSITIEGGINRFDGDVPHSKGYTTGVVPFSKTKLSYGCLLEYNFTPVWSLGVDYYFLPLEGKGSYFEFNTPMHNASLFVSFNPIRAYFKRSTKWSLSANLGLGYSWHTINYQTKTDDDWKPGDPKPTVPGAAGVHYEDRDVDGKKGNAMVVPMSLLLEYNILRSLAVGVRAQFRAYNKDDIDGRMRPNANDALELATLALRYKFKAEDKHQHTRNPIEIEETATKSELDKLRDQINAIVIPGPDPRIDDLDRRLKKLEDILCPDGPDTDGDGVPDCRDLEPDTPEGNQVDFWGRTIPKGTTYEPEAFIYFDFDRTNLDEEAQKAISIAAGKLQADPSLIVEVRGFTDNMGSIPYNADLSQRRAEVVKAELIEKYGIEADRIIANGKGKYNPEDKVIPYRPYRTAAFFYSK